MKDADNSLHPPGGGNRAGAGVALQVAVRIVLPISLPSGRLGLSQGCP